MERTRFSIINLFGLNNVNLMSMSLKGYLALRAAEKDKRKKSLHSVRFIV